MPETTLEDAFVCGWMAAASAYGGPADKNEEEIAKAAFREWSNDSNEPT